MVGPARLPRSRRPPCRSPWGSSGGGPSRGLRRRGNIRGTSRCSRRHRRRPGGPMPPRCAAILSACSVRARVVGEVPAATRGRRCGGLECGAKPPGTFRQPRSPRPTALPADVDPLSRILAAPAHEQLRDLGISSLDVLAILEGIGELVRRSGRRQGRSTGGRPLVRCTPWQAPPPVDGRRAGECAREDRRPRPAGGSGLRTSTTSSSTHSGAADDPYAVEFAFVVDPPRPDPLRARRPSRGS